ncbi:MAG: S41 family peptidase, partial [Bacteroidia bacterium]|nr:S41 family peptidase [Bacteroidia bacterium]
MKLKAYYPIVLALVLAAGLFIGNKLGNPFYTGNKVKATNLNQYNKLTEVISYIEQQYVDKIEAEELVDVSIEELLHHLDPHSSYIPAEDLNSATEPLEGNFGGIGIEFHIQNDTIMVVRTIAGGPSGILGMQSGDRITHIEDELVAGTGITNTDVMDKLRGEKGTDVNVRVYRRGVSDLIDFHITRNDIPIFSVEVSYMVDENTGYIKLNRFGAKTYDEFLESLEKLHQEGLQNLIIDLRGNPGGYLEAATKISDEFLDDGKMIVYTEGKASKKRTYTATSGGDFKTGNLVVLIDEGSASASEILAGALQDWDRATIIGRRSFGKGLVQEQTRFPDGSALRLTVSRYFTPTGRSIQKPYTDDVDAYNNELLERYIDGELNNVDSISFPDSLKYETPKGKVVFGGGGIMPDIFVPLDTTGTSSYYNKVAAQGLIVQYAYDYVDANRSELNDYSSYSHFNSNFQITDAVLSNFISYAENNGVKPIGKEIEISDELIRTRIKAFISRQLYQNLGFY